MSSEGAPTTRLGAQRQRWDYLVMKMDIDGFFGPQLDIDELRAYLDNAGEDGWELISVLPITRGEGRTANLVGILKRPR